MMTEEELERAVRKLLEVESMETYIYPYKIKPLNEILEWEIEKGPFSDLFRLMTAKDIINELFSSWLKHKGNGLRAEKAIQRKLMLSAQCNAIRNATEAMMRELGGTME